MDLQFPVHFLISSSSEGEWQVCPLNSTAPYHPSTVPFAQLQGQITSKSKTHGKDLTSIRVPKDTKTNI